MTNTKGGAGLRTSGRNTSLLKTPTGRNLSPSDPRARRVVSPLRTGAPGRKTSLLRLPVGRSEFVTIHGKRVGRKKSPLGDCSFGSENVTSIDLGSETVTVAVGN